MTATAKASLDLAHEARRAQGEATRTRIIDVILADTEALTVRDIKIALERQGFVYAMNHIQNILQELAARGVLERRHPDDIELSLLNMPTGMFKVPFVYMPAGERRVVRNLRSKRVYTLPTAAAPAPAPIRTSQIDKAVARIVDKAVADATKKLERENTKLRAEIEELKSALRTTARLLG